MDESLAGLLGLALPLARVSFGVDEEAVPAEALAAAGACMFGPTADGLSVGAILTNDQSTVEFLLGAVIAGVEVVSLPLPGRAVNPGDYLEFLRDACASTGVTHLVARDDIAAFLGAPDLEVVTHSALGTIPLAVGNGSFSLVQFSSGSTGSPKGIRLSDEMLGTNVVAILEAIAPVPGDATVSWLPLSHDMGLIGMVFSALVAFGEQWASGGELVLLEPELFLRSPAAWLTSLDRKGGTLTGAPDFGFRMAASRRLPHEVNLTRVRCAILGGEIVRSTTLALVEEVLGPMGLAAGALCPAYGMAELGLAACMAPPGERWTQRSFDGQALADGRCEPPQSGVASYDLVSSGVPLRGYEVVSRGADGEIAPLAIGAPTIGEDAATGQSLAGPDGRLDAGDLGCIEDGQVYVCGRRDDYLVVHGRNLYAPSIESAVGAVVGVRSGRVTAVGSPDGAWVIVVEADQRDRAERGAIRTIRAGVRRASVAASGVAPDEVLVLARGALPLTSSGKLQRHEVRKRWLTGRLDVDSLN